MDAYYTPFIRVEKEDSFRSRDMKDCDPELNSVELLVPQVLGGEPMELDVCLQMLEGRGYKQVDINMGCPFTMISLTGKGGWIVASPGEGGGFDGGCGFSGQCSEDAVGMGRPGECLKLLPLLNAALLAAIFLHARVGVQDTRERRIRRLLRFFTRNANNPLYYNGDVLTLEDIQAVTERFPRLRGVMIGEVCWRIRPWHRSTRRIRSLPGRND